MRHFELRSCKISGGLGEGGGGGAGREGSGEDSPPGNKARGKVSA